MNTTEAALRDALAPFAAGPCTCGAVYLASGNAVCASCKAREALSQPSPASSTVGEIARFVSKMEPLGSEFEKVWDDNADELYEGVSSPSSGEPASVAVEAEVTQADRDAASNYLDLQGGHEIDSKVIRRGDADGKYLVQAFARHRRAALSKPTPVEAGMLRERVRTALYCGLSWFGTLPEPEGDVPSRYHRWDDLGEFADRILAALSETQPPRETSTHTGETGE